MSKSPCHTHNNACFYWTTSRNATPRESHTLGVFGQCLHTCASLYPPSSSRNHITSHHPTPRIASVRLLLDSCARRLVARTSPTLSGRGSSGVHDGAVCFAFAAAWNCVRVALSLDAPSSDGGGSSGTHTEPVHLLCRLVAWSPAKALGGSSGIGRWTICFAHCRAPPCVRVAAGH